MIDILKTLFSSLLVGFGLFSGPPQEPVIVEDSVNQLQQEELIAEYFNEEVIEKSVEVNTEPVIIKATDYNKEAPIFQNYENEDLVNIATLENKINQKKDSNGIDVLLKPEVFIQREIVRINSRFSKQKMLDLLEKKDYYSESRGFVDETQKKYYIRKIESLFDEILEIQQQESVSRHEILKKETDYLVLLYSIKRHVGDLTETEVFEILQNKDNYQPHIKIIPKLIGIDEDLGFAMLGKDTELQNALRGLYTKYAETVLKYESDLNSNISIEDVIAGESDLTMALDDYYTKYLDSSYIKYLN
jgi:hypothetical protein